MIQPGSDMDTLCIVPPHVSREVGKTGNLLEKCGEIVEVGTFFFLKTTPCSCLWGELESFERGMFCLFIGVRIV